MIRYNVIILAIAALLGACDSRLDVEPRQTLASSVVLVNEENLTSVLFGAYAGLKGSFGTNEGGELYGGDVNIMSEMLGSTGNVTWAGSFSTYREMDAKELTVTNGVVTSNWIRAYDVINSANTVLANLDLASDETRAGIEGQALTIRAMVYFELVRFWCKPWGTGTEATDPGIPLVLTPITTAAEADATATLGRSNVQAIYDQILDDLKKAKTSLESLGKNGTNISTYTASATLSRVYLQRGNFADAVIEADRVIASAEYSLNPTPLACFNNAANTAEDIFAIQQTSLSNAGTSNGGITTFYARLFGIGRGDIQVQQDFIDSFEADDLRGGVQDDLSGTATIGAVGEMYYIGVGGQNFGQIQSAKYGDPNLNIPVVRIAEMYLTRAEANFEEGTEIGDTPLNDINEIRNRAGLTNLTTVDQAIIRSERTKELAFEGFKLHDAKRWKLDIGTLAFDANELVLPIPERETEAFDIDQNAGYGQ